jgi:DNA-binding response OmpR family regulator
MPSKGKKPVKQGGAKIGKARVLIVEDEQALRELYREWLTMSGFTVLEADDGLVGIERVLHDEPDLVVLDVMLPKKDGFEVLQEVRRNPKTKTIPILILTSLDQDFERRQGGKLGADRYVVKTDLSPALLQEAVSDLLAKRA